jgi:RNA polymerase sigma-70 factor (ECF subfamily)
MTEIPPSPQAPDVRPAVSRAERAAPLTEFRELFVSEFSWVCRTLRRFGVRPRDLEDAAQEVFVGVHKKLDEYDRARPVRPWLAAFAYRVASNQNRLARHRREVLDEAAPELAGDLDPERALAAKRDRELVLWALQSVELSRRAVLVMHDIDEFKAQEVADALAIPLNTVYSRLRVARSELRNALEPVREKRRPA